MTAQYPQAAVVTDTGVYCDNANMYFVQLPEITETKLYALSAIINSSVFNTLARSIANPQQNGYYKFDKQFLEPVPFPKVAFVKNTANIRKLAKVAKRIEETNEQIRTSIGGQTTGLENSLKSLWAELDQICDKLYGLTIEEKGIIYSTHRFDRDPYGQED